MNQAIRNAKALILKTDRRYTREGEGLASRVIASTSLIGFMAFVIFGAPALVRALS